jgi:hypothetical protein
LHMGETIRVTVFEHRFGGFTYCLAVAGDQPCFSRQTFATADAAKLAAFDWLTEEGRWNDAS